jgi:recombination protein RecT
MANIEKVQENMSERFTTAVLKEFGTSVSGAVQATDYQRNLVQGYFIAIDRMLNDLEADRIRKNEKNTDHRYDNGLAYIWNNVNMATLARDVMSYSKMGLDMLAANHLFAIPYKNSKTQKYDLGFIKGYDGIKMLVEKYALVKPKAVTIEVVYQNDTFKPLKKCRDNAVESYLFEIDNPFDRGEIIGGFGYVEHDDPSLNKLFVMTMKDIDKRKPQYAAAEFWGGKKDEYKNGGKTGNKIEVEGWKDEMVTKSLIRHVYGKIPLDPKKIDDDFKYIQARESEYKDSEINNEIAEKANKEPLNITPDKPIKHESLETPTPTNANEAPPTPNTEPSAGMPTLGTW